MGTFAILFIVHTKRAINVDYDSVRFNAKHLLQPTPEKYKTEKCTCSLPNIAQEDRDSNIAIDFVVIFSDGDTTETSHSQPRHVISTSAVRNLFPEINIFSSSNQILILLPLRRNSDPGSHSMLISSLSTTIYALHLYRAKGSAHSSLVCSR